MKEPMSIIIKGGRNRAQYKIHDTHPVNIKFPNKKYKKSFSTYISQIMYLILILNKKRERPKRIQKRGKNKKKGRGEAEGVERRERREVFI